MTFIDYYKQSILSSMPDNITLFNHPDVASGIEDFGVLIDSVVPVQIFLQEGATSPDVELMSKFREHPILNKDAATEVLMSHIAEGLKDELLIWSSLWNTIKNTSRAITPTPPPMVTYTSLPPNGEVLKATLTSHYPGNSNIIVLSNAIALLMKENYLLHMTAAPAPAYTPI